MWIYGEVRYGVLDRWLKRSVPTEPAHFYSLENARIEARRIFKRSQEVARANARVTASAMRKRDYTTR